MSARSRTAWAPLVKSHNCPASMPTFCRTMLVSTWNSSLFSRMQVRTVSNSVRGAASKSPPQASRLERMAFSSCLLK